MPRWRNMTIIRGHISLIPNKTYMILHAGTAVLRVRFFMNVLPPDIRDADRVTLVGSMETHQQGDIAMLRHALHIPEGYAKLLGEVREVIARYRADPREYITQEEQPRGRDEGVHLPGTRDF